MKTKITLNNTFHQTEVTIQPHDVRGSDGVLYFELSSAQARKIARNLCGMSDCSCGTIRDERVFNWELNPHPLSTTPRFIEMLKV